MKFVFSFLEHGGYTVWRTKSWASARSCDDDTFFYIVLRVSFIGLAEAKQYRLQRYLMHTICLFMLLIPPQALRGDASSTAS